MRSKIKGIEIKKKGQKKANAHKKTGFIPIAIGTDPVFNPKLSLTQISI